MGDRPMPEPAGVDEVREQVIVFAPESAVWSALVERERRCQWWSYLALDPTVGGELAERWTDSAGEEVLTKGVVTEVVPFRRLRMTWADESWPAETEVTITLTPGDQRTTVEIRHCGWLALPDGGRLAEEHRAGWRLHLANLRAFAEG